MSTTPPSSPYRPPTNFHTCPVCTESYPPGIGFSLHVVECTTPSTLTERPPPLPCATTDVRSCPMCHMVYPLYMRAYEMEFHEFECARVNAHVLEPLSNETNGEDEQSGESSRALSGVKRTREHSPLPSPSSSNGHVKLFPAHCNICLQGGRSLLRCHGKCARSFHSVCMDELNTSISPLSSRTSLLSSSSSSLLRRSNKPSQWMCGECTRGLYRCQQCGFLSPEGVSSRMHQVVQCSINDCGYFYHPACLETASLPFICPRHMCKTCHQAEGEMTRGRFCTQCTLMTHRHCPSTSSSTSSDLLDPFFFVCKDHSTKSSTTSSTDQQVMDRKRQFTALPMHVHVGEIVLILEFMNAVLPMKTKQFCPHTVNQWGVVQRIEEVDEAVLLHVLLFADGSIMTVLHSYVLPLANAQLFTTPVEMIQTCIQWHTVCELCVLEPKEEYKPVLEASIAAFAARIEALEMEQSDCMAAAERGYEVWKVWKERDVRVYDGEWKGRSSSVPVYALVDTRPPRHGEGGGEEEDGEEEGGEEDVEMNGEGEDEFKSSSQQGSNDVRSTMMNGGGEGSGEGGEDSSQPEENTEVLAVLNEILCSIVQEQVKKEELMSVDIPVVLETPLKRTYHQIKEEVTTITPPHKKIQLIPSPSKLFSTNKPSLIPLQDNKQPLPPSLQVYHMTHSRPSYLQKLQPLETPEFSKELNECPTLVPCSLPSLPSTPIRYTGYQRQNLDTISRILLCQDQRNVECFLYCHPIGTSPNDIHSSCLLSKPSPSIQPTRVEVDLMGIYSFKNLKQVLLNQIATILPSPVITEFFKRRTLPRSKVMGLQIQYCSKDGKQHTITSTLASMTKEWLCFCANVRHLTVIALVDDGRSV